jgi:hypothetical protein
MVTLQGFERNDLIPIHPPLSKGGKPLSSLWKREVGRDFTKTFQTAKLKRIMEY